MCVLVVGTPNLAPTAAATSRTARSCSGAAPLNPFVELEGLTFLQPGVCAWVVDTATVCTDSRRVGWWRWAVVVLVYVVVMNRVGRWVSVAKGRVRDEGARPHPRAVIFVFHAPTRKFQRE